MKIPFLSITRFAGFAVTLCIWRMIQYGQFTPLLSWMIITGSVILIFPIVWIGRQAVDSKPTAERLAWITTIIHAMLMIVLGVSIIEAVKFFRIDPGIRLPIPAGIGLSLLSVTAPALFLTVLNLALSGLGAPFAIALSKRLADRWMYRWTRNPMVLCTLASLFSAGLYFQSLYFILWVILLVVPAFIFFLKVYEERELEIRFGLPYLEYKARTPFLWPGKQLK
jgi:protein-S-isoprenylcysteine O-methyltransferase Ste14